MSSVSLLSVHYQDIERKWNAFKTSFQENLPKEIEKNTQELIEALNVVKISSFRTIQNLIEFKRGNQRMRGEIQKIESLFQSSIGQTLISLFDSNDKILDEELNKNRVIQDVLDKELNLEFEHLPVKKGDSFFISGYVMSDGVGDYAYILRILEKLHKKFPENALTAVIVSAKKHKGSLTPLHIPNCKVYLSYDERNSDQGVPTGDHDFFDAKTKTDIGEILKTSALWINGPKHIPYLFDELEHIPEMMKLIEYDKETNTAADFCYSANMGLGGKGIFIKKRKEYHWKDFENERLKRILFGVPNPTDENIQSYASSSDLYLCYIGDKEIATSFIQCAIQDSSDNKKTIDICFPSKNKAIQSLANEEGNVFLEDPKIGMVEFLYFEEGKLKEVRFSQNGWGKKLRIFDVGALSKRDFNRIAYLSSSLMGCTGDSSLGIALSFNKIPYYERREHKKDLLGHLCQLALENLGEDSSLYQLLNALLNQGSVKDKNLLEKILKSTIRKEAQVLGEYIRSKLSFNRYFLNWVNKILFVHQNSEYRELENEVRIQLMREEIDFKRAKEILIQKIR